MLQAPMLQARGVVQAFGRLRAVDGADLDVTEGEIVGLIGPNGAGKSTFFNALAGDRLPTAGRIVFDGHDVTRAGPAAHARLGIARTFQVPVTFEDMTVAENVLVGAFLRHPGRTEAARAAEEVLAFTGLDGQARAPARAGSARRGASGSRSRARSRPRRACCCSTRRSPASIPPRCRRRSRWCGAFTRAASRW